MGKPGRDSATRQEVRLGEPPTRTRCGGYHLARTTLRGRAGDRGEGRVERGESGYLYSNAG